MGEKFFRGINLVAATVTTLGVPYALYNYYQGREPNMVILIITVGVLLVLAWAIISIQSFWVVRALKARDDQHENKCGELNQRHAKQIGDCKDQATAELLAMQEMYLSKEKELRQVIAKQGRYIDAMPDFRLSLQNLRNCWHMLHDDGDSMGAMQLLNTSIQNLAACFSLATGRACLVQLKTTYYLDGQGPGGARSLMVDHLCNSHALPWMLPMGAEDRVVTNVDFDFFANRPAHGWYFNNDLSRGDYINKEYSNGRTNGGPRNFLSTIVWPIRWMGHNENEGPRYHYELVGFLCLRCAERDAFDENVDAYAGSVWANAAFPVISTIARLRDNHTEEEVGVQPPLEG
ncbi:MAG: hypothetical protein KQH53_18865 [Desulfarculaceae bacterium]|nr:hypothetical protein [Desulfarculaceae bacterium]